MKKEDIDSSEILIDDADNLVSPTWNNIMNSAVKTNAFLKAGVARVFTEMPPAVMRVLS